MKWIKVFDNFNTNAIEDYFIGLEDDNFCQSIEVSSLRDILEKGMAFGAVNFSENDINILRSAYEILPLSSRSHSELPKRSYPPTGVSV